MRTIRMQGQAMALAGALALGAPAAAAQEGLRFEAAEGAVRALAGEEVRWSFAVNPSAGAPALLPPVRVGDALVFCHEAQVYEAGAADGKIRRRLLLPGRCAGLTAAAAGYEVTAEGPLPGRGTWKKPFSFRPGEGDPGSLLPSELLLLMTPRRQADALAGKPAGREAGVERLQRQREADPTNPWLDLRRAELLRELGRGDEAARAVKEALGHDPRYDFDLLPMSARLGAFDQAAGDEAFHRGMSFLLRHGYEPELATGAILPMVLLGRPGVQGGPGAEPRPLDPARDSALLERHAGRLLDLAPEAEGTTWFFAALARAAEQRGDQAAARRFGPLAARERGTGPVAPQPPESRDAGAYLQLAGALAFALAVIALIKSLRGLSLRLDDGAPWWSRYNPCASWDRGEQLGFLAGTAALLAASWKASMGVAIIGLIAAAPVSMMSGDPGQPEARAYLDAGPDAPAARFFRALSAHKAGDLGAAEALYRQDPTAEALNNLGVIAAARGDQARAAALWAEALQKQPTLDAALYNAQKPTDSPRAERARRYGLTAPMVALPSTELWYEFWRERARLPGAGGLRRVASIFVELAPGPPGLEGVRLAPVAVLALAALAALALLSPRRLSPAAPAWGQAASGLALFLPGAGRFYGLFSPFVGAATLFLSMGAYLLGTTGGQSLTVLGSIVSPSWERFYGAALVAPELPWLAPAARLWWLLFAANAALVLAFDLRRAGRPAP